MSSPDDRPAPPGAPVPPRWDVPPQAPAWDAPAGMQQWGPPPPYGAPPGYGHYAPPVPTDSTAVAGLVLAICAWVLLPVVLAVVALVLASSSARTIAASGGRLGGQGLNTATKWVAWLNIGFWVLLAVLVLGAFAVFDSSGFS